MADSSMSDFPTGENLSAAHLFDARGLVVAVTGGATGMREIYACEVVNLAQPLTMP